MYSQPSLNAVSFLNNTANVGWLAASSIPIEHQVLPYNFLNIYTLS